MGYIHLPNLYKDQSVLLFKECYVLEKIHGTSAYVAWRDGHVTFSSGGESHEKFKNLFDEEKLAAGFSEFCGQAPTVVHGEAYGGKQQGMKDTYGPNLKFIVFDIKINGLWLTVPEMTALAQNLGFEVVQWSRVETDLAVLDFHRDAPSVQAVLNGITEPRKREGIVIRPLIEVTMSNGERVIAKHKGADFQERKTQPKVVDAAKQEVLAKAEAIANEWVTPLRLEHVLDKIPQPHEFATIPLAIKAMIEDVYREGKGEIVESKDAERAIGTRTAKLYKARITSVK